MNRNDFVTNCDDCGEAIWVGEDYYELPDGSVLCDSCMGDWLFAHRRCRAYSEVEV